MGRFSRGVYPFVYLNCMKKIKLTRGREALVDDEDFERLSSFNWQCTEHGYARRRVSNKVFSYMHREVMSAKSSETIDHRNSDKLDNRKENLRFCTPGQNAKNSNRKPGATGLCGVYINNPLGKTGNGVKNKFVARIRVDMKNVWLGRYATAEEAHRVYVDACKKYHGSFSRYSRLEEK